MLQIDVKLLDRVALAARRCPERAVDIIQSLKYNQLASKHQIVKELPQNTNLRVGVLGGWYGIGFMALSYTHPHLYTIIDCDPICKIVGDIINYPRFSFITGDACKIDTTEYDVLVNCSSEHMDRSLLAESFREIKHGKRYIIQNNNNFDVPDHVNCFATRESFVEYLSNHFAIEKATTTTMDNGTERYTVICRKM